MKRCLLIQVISSIVIFFASVFTAHAADVGISFSIAQPGFFGRIDIGSFPRPEVIYPKPVIIGTPVRGAAAKPLYLRVPPHHRNNWGKYHAGYNAHGRPVYFVTERWYSNVYAPGQKAKIKSQAGHHFQKQHKTHPNGKGRGR